MRRTWCGLLALAALTAGYIWQRGQAAQPALTAPSAAPCLSGFTAAADEERAARARGVSQLALPAVVCQRSTCALAGWRTPPSCWRAAAQASSAVATSGSLPAPDALRSPPALLPLSIIQPASVSESPAPAASAADSPRRASRRDGPAMGRPRRAVASRQKATGSSPAGSAQCHCRPLRQSQAKSSAPDGDSARVAGRDCPADSPPARRPERRQSAARGD